MFRTQLRAICGRAAHGKVNLLFPMVAQPEYAQTLAQVELAQAELDARGVAYGAVQLGAMIEIPRPPSWCAASSSTLISYRLAPTI